MSIADTVAVVMQHLTGITSSPAALAPLVSDKLGATVSPIEIFRAVRRNPDRFIVFAPAGTGSTDASLRRARVGLIDSRGPLAAGADGTLYQCVTLLSREAGRHEYAARIAEAVFEADAIQARLADLTNIADHHSSSSSSRTSSKPADVAAASMSSPSDSRMPESTNLPAGFKAS